MINFAHEAVSDWIGAAKSAGELPMASMIVAKTGSVDPKTTLTVDQMSLVAGKDALFDFFPN